MNTCSVATGTWNRASASSAGARIIADTLIAYAPGAWAGARSERKRGARSGPYPDELCRGAVSVRGQALDVGATERSRTMDRMIFVNLPVRDVQVARTFYTGLGF